MTETSKEENTPRLPETVSCVLGTKVSYDKFKEHYQQVYDQILAMDHLLLGRVVYDGKVGRLEYQIGSLRLVETNLLRSIFSADTNFAVANGDYDLCRLTMALQMVSGSPLGTVSPTSDMTLAQWKDRAAVQLGVINQYDEQLVTYLLAVLTDVEQAKQFAFAELLPDPSEPH